MALPLLAMLLPYGRHNPWQSFFVTWSGTK
jgi:hypothetical protein